MVSRKVAELLEPKALAIIAVAVTIMLSAGIFYVLSERPPFSLGVRLVYPGGGAQTVSEFFIVAFLYAMGFAGLMLIYEAPRHRYRRSFMISTLLSGAALLVISTLLLLLVYGMK
ncbi:MAG: hypothetical protein QXT33_00525 [Thermofilum sp.]